MEKPLSGYRKAIERVLRGCRGCRATWIWQCLSSVRMVGDATNSKQLC